MLSVSYSPNGKYILSSGADGTIRQWDVSTNKQICDPIIMYEGPGHLNIECVDYNHNGTRFVGSNNCGTIGQWYSHL